MTSPETSAESAESISRADLRYITPLIVATVGIITYVGPWQGYWETAGLFMAVAGGLLWLFWEGIQHV